MPRGRHKILFPLLAMGLGLALALGLLETAARFLPVSGQPFPLPVTQADPVARYTPNQPFTYSAFADFSLRNHARSNNWGFINDQDYRSDSPLPLVAAIGDSFVEAMMVPPPDTFHARLARELDGKARVYSFAKGGAPLSQYLAYAKFARAALAPARMIFVIVHNDFDLSLERLRRNRGFHQFAEDGRGGLVLTLNELPGETPLTWLARHSHLMRYLIRNVKIDAIKMITQGDKHQFTRPVALDEPRVVDSRRVVDAFFRLLPEAAGLPPGQVLFVLDAVRPDLYFDQVRQQVPNGYFRVMRAYFMEQAARLGYKYIDMDPILYEAFKRDGLRFEFANDLHWNSHGHEAVARAILRSGFLDHLTD